MRARTINLSGLLIAGTLILTLVAGCGKRVGPEIDPAEQPAQKPGASTPAPEPPAPAPQPTPPVTQPGNPSQPTNPGNPTAQLQATVDHIKNGSFLGMGTLVVKVKVTNPTQFALTGEVTVAFTKGGKPTSEAASERVSLLPNETIYKYFENSKWSLDGATVTVKTDAPLSGTKTFNYGY